MSELFLVYFQACKIAVMGYTEKVINILCVCHTLCRCVPECFNYREIYACFGYGNRMSRIYASLKI